MTEQLSSCQFLFYRVARIHSQLCPIVCLVCSRRCCFSDRDPLSERSVESLKVVETVCIYRKVGVRCFNLLVAS